MATKLIPLSQIPYRARETEARERAKWPTWAMALDAATIRIIAAPGCYGSPFPPVYGWVLTIEAAQALAAIETRMPGGSSHHRLDYDEYVCSTDALSDYLEAVARDPSEAGREKARNEYEAARRG